MKKIIVLIIVLINSSSCKKYEEGPAFSLKTIHARITGEWEVTHYMVDEKDSTDLLRSNPCYGNLVLKEFNPKEYNHNADIKNNSTTCPNGFGCVGSWNLSVNKKIIRLSFIDKPPYYSIQAPYGKVGSKIDWEILKLYNKIMKLKTIYLDKTYIITLKKIKELK